MLDLKNALCYSMTYLSDERFLFARFFPRRRSSDPAARQTADKDIPVLPNSGINTGRQCPLPAGK